MTSSNSPTPVAARVRDNATRAAWACVSLSVVVVVWQLAHHASGLSQRILPAPTTILASAAASWPSLSAAAWATGVEGIAGMIAGIAVGIVIAFTTSLWPRLTHVAMPILVVSQTVPLVAVAPLMVIWMGFTMASKIVVVAVFTAFPVALALLRGLGRVPTSLTDPMGVAGASRMWILLHARLPWAHTHLFSGIRIAATYAFASAATAEFMGAKRGLGVFLLSAQSSFRTDLVFAGAGTLVVMTIILYAIVAAAEALTSRRSLPGRWRRTPGRQQVAPGRIEMTSVSKTYRSSQGEVRALDGADLIVEEGTIAAVVGPSGCGKSTLIRIAAGLERADNATGQGKASESASCALMPQSDSLAPWLRVRDNVALPLVLAGASKRDALTRADATLDSLGLGSFASHRPDELSGGMRARVAFARTLLTPTSAMLLDEPFGALDALTRAQVCDWLGDLLHKDPRTTVIVTHDILEAVQLADTVHVMSARPGHITDSIRIDLPYPRGRGTRRLERFHALCARVEDALTTNNGRTRHEGTPCQSHE